MTVTEKILSRHARLTSVQPGQFIESSVDLVLINDITGPLAIEEFRRAGAGSLFNPQKVVLVPDHFTPCKDIRSAELVKTLRLFAREYGAQFYEIGRAGIEHALLPEQGLTRPGDLIIGADSHTCSYGAVGAFSTGVGSTDAAAAMITGSVWLKVPQTIKIEFHGSLQPYTGGKDLILYTIGRIGVDGARYRAMEFSGSTISSLGMDDRLTMCNMAIEAGAKNGIIAPDDVTRAFMATAAPNFQWIDDLVSDADAGYERVLSFDSTRIGPQVAAPPSPGNVADVREFSDVRIDMVA